jgi:hypothetical protein
MSTTTSPAWSMTLVAYFVLNGVVGPIVEELSRRRILIILLVLAALPLVGAGWQRLATHRDQLRQHPHLLSLSPSTTAGRSCICALRVVTTA